MANRDRDRDEEFRGGAEEPGGRRPFGGESYGRGYETGGRRQFGREFEPGGYGRERGQGGSPGYGGRGFSGESGGYGSQGYGYGSESRSLNDPSRTGSREFGPGSYGRGYEGTDRESGWGGSMSGYGSSSQRFSGPSSTGSRGQEFGGGYGYSGFGSSSGYSGYSEGQFGTGSRTRGRYTGRGPKNYTRSDDRIREDVSDRLEQHGEIDATEIEVRVENGEVTLEGTVEDRRMKRLAEDVVEDCPGVKQVHNRIRVQGNGNERSLSSGQRTSGQQTTGSKTGSTTSRTSTRT
jgi:BON domain-containing protein